MKTPKPEFLKGIANQLRIHSIKSTTAAGSGHPSSCCSAAELMATLFFSHMRYDPKNPAYHNNDRFILSKGHAAPVLYAAWVEAGVLDESELTSLRQFGSRLEGHPTPRLPFVDIATGSLGQGLSVGVGEALNAKLDQLDYHTYVMLGDGECAEGSVWEAASMAGIRKLGNLTALIDVNRLGQSEATPFEHDLEVYEKRFQAFGWETAKVDGHNPEEILKALNAEHNDKPLAIIARTKKGAGVAIFEDKDGWHGKALPPEEAEKAIQELKPKSESASVEVIPQPSALPKPAAGKPSDIPAPSYDSGDKAATRQAYGNAITRLGQGYPQIVVLDGDVKNSTYAGKFAEAFPDRFIESYIAEQNMVGMATGLSIHGKLPFVSSFGAFLSRAHDQIRMAAHSHVNLKLAGSHVGVSIGEDGGSQMALEDISMMRALPGSVVLYPCDAVSTEKLVEKMLSHNGISYLRTSRPKTPVIYSNDDEFDIGGARVLRQTDDDVLTVVAAGVTVFEALEAADLLKSDGIGITVIDAYSVKPLPVELLLQAAHRTHRTVLTVEDHYPEGGLGDAVASALAKEGIYVHKLAVDGVPHSGSSEELLNHFGIDSESICAHVEEIASHMNALHRTH